MIENNVFSRKSLEGLEINATAYNLIIGMCLLWGFFVNYQMVINIPVESIVQVGFLPLLIGYFVSCFIGIFMFNGSTNPLVSFIGYNFVVVPFGLIINIAVAQYDSSIVSEAIRITGMVTLMMMVLGAIFPAFFNGIARALSLALICMIVIELFQIFVLGKVSAWIDYVVVLIFCGYIGVDWARANAIPKTVDNAVDSAAALYMDIINLFLRIMRILARRK